VHVRVLELVLQVDLASDGHTVVGDHRRSGDLLQDDVAPLGPEGGLHGFGQLIDAGQQQAAGIRTETQFLGHDFLLRLRG
jgi:hypothetical protein